MKQQKNEGTNPFSRIYKQVYTSASYKTRLVLSFMLIAVPLLIILCGISFYFLKASTTNTIKQEQAGELERFNTQMQYIISDTENMSREIIFNYDVQELLESAHAGDAYPEYTNVAYYINNYIANRDFVKSVVLIGSGHTLYSTDRAFTNDAGYQNICAKWWYSQVVYDNSSYIWYPYATLTTLEYQQVRLGENTHATNTLMLIRPIYSIKDYVTPLGYIMIYLDDSYIQNVWDSVTWGDTSNIFMLDAQNDILIYNHQDTDYSDILDTIALPDGSMITKWKHHIYVVSGSAMSTNNWKLCMITPLKEVNKSLNILTVELLIIVCIIVFVFIFLVRYSANAMARPITKLSEIMDSYHGEDYLASPPPDMESYKDRTDEIGKMYRSYEQLEHRLDMLIQEIYVKNLEKKDAELALLQSQINPHFLYNTLDSINWLALENDQEEISEMIHALSDTFRLSLMKNNSTFVEMEQEIQYIQSYLILQKFRYGDRLHYSFDIPDNIPKLYLPRFILQPIVENALKHGIDKIEGGGNITISIKISDDILITVINNGNKIDLKQMDELLHFDPKESDILAFKKDGYGIQNIFRRIKIMCGDAYGISYEKTDTQTFCHIHLPKKETL